MDELRFLAAFRKKSNKCQFVLDRRTLLRDHLSRHQKEAIDLSPSNKFAEMSAKLKPAYSSIPKS